MNCKKRWSCKFNNEEGSIIVIVALFMTVLIGFAAFVLDIGLAYNSKAKLQAALDSSALAAVRELPLSKNQWSQNWNDAIDAGKKYAFDNGVESPDDLTFYAIDENKNYIPVNKDNYKLVKGIQVVGQKQVYYKFARVLGFNSGAVKCDATAKLVDISGMSGLLPFVLRQSDIENIESNPDANIPIKYTQNKKLGESGWFGAVRLDGSGADDYRDDMINGCEKEFFIGSNILLEGGNMVGPTREGFFSRYSGHETCNEDTCYSTVDDTCKRIVAIPIVQIVYAANGNIDHLEVKGFASVFLEGFKEYDENGNLVSDNPTDKSNHSCVLEVSYINDLNVSGAISDSGDIVNSYNVKATKLVD